MKTMITICILLAVFNALFFSYLIHRDFIDNTGHKCKWELCPYKSIKEADYSKAVSKYVGDSESEAYSLDMLHLLNPKCEYEELEEMLTND